MACSHFNYPIEPAAPLRAHFTRAGLILGFIPQKAQARRQD
jgi:hypothetical protein